MRFFARHLIVFSKLLIIDKKKKQKHLKAERVAPGAVSPTTDTSTHRESSLDLDVSGNILKENRPPSKIHSFINIA